MNDLLTRTKFNNFLFDCLKKYGRRASILFSNINFGKLDRDLIVKLHNEFSDIFDFNMIDAKSLFNETYDLIGEVAQIKTDTEAVKDEMIKYKEKIDDVLNEMRKLNIQSAEEFQSRLKSIEDEQSHSVEKIKEFENKYEEAKSDIQDLNGKISNINGNVDSLNGNLDNLRNQLNDSNNETQNKLNELENQLNEQENLFLVL